MYSIDDDGDDLRIVAVFVASVVVVRTFELDIVVVLAAVAISPASRTLSSPLLFASPLEASDYQTGRASPASPWRWAAGPRSC